MTLEQILKNYHGQKLNEQEVSYYQKWAMEYFHNDEHVTDPYISMTIDLNITQVRENYELHYQHEHGASFQGFMIWCLARALKSQWTFSSRNIGGEWYRFDNLPIFTPIAVGGDLRFKDVVLEDTSSMSWKEFASYYRAAVDDTDQQLEILPQDVWALCPFIGNLPNLDFSALNLHRNRIKTGRPMFYFGKRRNNNGVLSVPLSISFDHANSDPYVLDKLINTLNEYLTEVPKNKLN
ncbi:hypothetical protein D5018_11545 [Parashewanella curva]|uniref:Chloramphenicol acetyltransferase n=1 Tax=Parashewanella curva TaxID=2338552 RepID=A0A3L8PW92_9GAMM|nr:CatA-like O-acetyltransferase [Parashewanella curva]RLV59580.1 hypothetical protein D5018_11545 [Parashewanella curva]